MEDAIERKRVELRSAMSALGRRILNGDTSQIIHWVISHKLACAHRPLRYHPLYCDRRNLDPGAMELIHEWVLEIQLNEIKSIISLNLSIELKISFVDFKGLRSSQPTQYCESAPVSPLFRTSEFNPILGFTYA